MFGHTQKRDLRRLAISTLLAAGVLTAAAGYSTKAGPDRSVGGPTYSLDYYQTALGAVRGDSSEFSIESALRIGASNSAGGASANYAIGNPMAAAVVPAAVRREVWTQY